MSAELFITVVVNIAIFYFLWFFLFKEYFEESHRHSLFILRENLFDFATEHELDFEKNKAVKQRWVELNSMIANTNETHIMFLSTLFRSKKQEQDVGNYLVTRTKLEEDTPEYVQKFLQDNRYEEFKIFFSYLIKSSFLMFILSILVISVTVLVAFVLMLIKQIGIQDKTREQLYDAFESYQYTAVNSN